MSKTGALAIAAALVSGACAGPETPAVPRASGYVEATEVRVASKVPGRVLAVSAEEGTRVEAGAMLVTLATTDADLALRRAEAERAQAVAQVRLLEAGARPEDIEQAEAQQGATAAERTGALADLAAARDDVERFEQLVRARAGSLKQRDDAVARRAAAEARVQAADDRVRAAAAALARLRAGARPEELAAARARVAAAEAAVARLEYERSEATIASPGAMVVGTRLVEPGELVAPGQPLVVLIDLDRAWANAYVEEPLVPSLRLDGEATVVTDAGDRIPGRITFISPRAEFTPRTVQTAEERAKLVYRVKVGVDNRGGVLKPGMPVEVIFDSGR